MPWGSCPHDGRRPSRQSSPPSAGRLDPDPGRGACMASTAASSIFLELRALPAAPTKACRGRPSLEALLSAALDLSVCVMHVFVTWICSTGWRWGQGLGTHTHVRYVRCGGQVLGDQPAACTVGFLLRLRRRRTALGLAAGSLPSRWGPGASSLSTHRVQGCRTGAAATFCLSMGAGETQPGMLPTWQLANLVTLGS